MKPSLHHLAVALAALVAALLPAGRALAEPWSIQPGLISQETAERVAERYPEVRSPAELDALLLDLGRRTQFLWLEARWQAGAWVITGARAPLITDLDVDLVTRELRQPVYVAVQNYIGQVDSPETRAKVESVVRTYMRRRGYPDSHVTLTAAPADDGISYNISANEGDPCLIDAVALGFKLPTGTKVGVGRGDLCDVEQIETAIGNLETELRDRGYNQIKLELGAMLYHPEKGTATVDVAGQLGQKVRYEIVDPSHRFLIDDLFGDEDLTKVDPTIVGPEAMAAELTHRYMNNGFLDVKVRGPEVRKGGEDELVYVYNVDPGKQYVLKNVQFEGATVFKEAELLDTMGLASLWQTARPYNYDELQSGLNAVRAKYQEDGYWDTKIREPSPQRDKESGAIRLTIQIEEGKQRRLQKVTVTGNKEIPADEIAAMLDVGVEAPLDRAKLVDFQQQVRAAYIARGYLYVDAQLDLKATNSKHGLLVDVQVVVNEGPRVKIGDITVVGLIRTHEKVVRRELLFHQGDWYDPEKINASRQALSRLGLFRSVQIAPADHNAIADKAREIDLVVDVREDKPGNVSFGPGWSLVKGWNYGADATYKNIGGVGRTATIRGSISEEKDQYAIGPRTLLGRKIGAGYVEPYLLDLPVDASIKASQEAQWLNDLWQITDGGEVALIHRLNWLLPLSSVSVFYGIRSAKSEGSLQELEQQVATDERVGDVGLRLNIDARDNVKFPTRGYTFDSEVAFARYDFGGDTRFMRWDAGASFYYGFLATLVLAVNIDLTSYENIQRKGDQVQILATPERLISGGAETVRGYPEDSLGPVVRSPVFSLDAKGKCSISSVSTPLNGTSRTTIKTELRHKLTDSVAVTGFVDSGNTWLSPDQMQKFQQAYGPIGDPNVAQDPDCQGKTAERSVQDNFSYNYLDLLRNPGYLWSKHYDSYGAAVNLLTALGSVNLAYGLPWHEPQSADCKQNSADCNPREHQTSPWIRRGEFIINVGARF